MSRLQGNSSLKRKRQDSTPQTPEDILLELVKKKANMGIWIRDLKRESNLAENVVNKAMKTLLAQNLIKEVVNIQSKGRKHYMAAEFEPSKELSGGAWYVGGKLDMDFIAALKDSCLKIIRKLKVATAEGISDFFKKNKLTTVDCTTERIKEILDSLVLENEIIEVKSTGRGEYASFQEGTVCYKSGSGMKLDTGAMASIPCGVCPRIAHCTPDGIISPQTCVYFTKWLDFDF